MGNLTSDDVVRTVHTPGPWALSEESPKIIKQAEVWKGSGGVMLASAHGNDNSGFFPSEAEGRANAVLIAAAPDLLAALRRLVGEPDDPRNGWLGDAKTSRDHFRCEYCGVEDLDCVALPHAPDCPVTQARAAIAKATP